VFCSKPVRLHRTVDSKPLTKILVAAWLIQSLDSRPRLDQANKMEIKTYKSTPTLMALQDYGSCQHPLNREASERDAQISGGCSAELAVGK